MKKQVTITTTTTTTTTSVASHQFLRDVKFYNGEMYGYEDSHVEKRKKERKNMKKIRFMGGKKT